VLEGVNGGRGGSLREGGVDSEDTCGGEDYDSACGVDVLVHFAS
jgi:hypothetical protein